MQNVHTLAVQTAEAPEIPAAARFYLWSIAALCLLISLCMGMMFCAGPKPEGRSTWAPFAPVAAVTLLFHIGYLIAPLAVRASWWKWSFWAMAPLGAIVVLGPLVPLIRSLGWTPPDGSSKIAGFARMGSMVLIAAAVYAVPPTLLWWLAPRSTP